MREIQPNKLWLGNMADTAAIETLMQAGVSAVIDLAAEQSMPKLPRSLVYCRFPILDGQQLANAVLQTAIETLVLFLRKDIPMLVYCSAGMSRSPAVVAAALSIIQKGNPDEQLKAVLSGYPHDVSPQLWQNIRDICRQIACH